MIFILDVMNCGLNLPLVHRRQSPVLFRKNLPAKLNSSQLHSLAGGKGLRWLLLPTAYVIIFRNSTPGSTSGCVTGSYAACENQALNCLIAKAIGHQYFKTVRPLQTGTFVVQVVSSYGRFERT